MSPSCASSIAMYTSRDDDTRDPLTILSGPAGHHIVQHLHRCESTTGHVHAGHLSTEMAAKLAQQSSLGTEVRQDTHQIV